jgi:hypothetical protein
VPLGLCHLFLEGRLPTRSLHKFLFAGILDETFYIMILMQTSLNIVEQNRNVCMYNCMYAFIYLSMYVSMHVFMLACMPADRGAYMSLAQVMDHHLVHFPALPKCLPPWRRLLQDTLLSRAYGQRRCKKIG